MVTSHHASFLLRVRDIIVGKPKGTLLSWNSLSREVDIEHMILITEMNVQKESNMILLLAVTLDHLILDVLTASRKGHLT